MVTRTVLVCPGETIGPSMSIPLPSIASPCEIVPWFTPCRTYSPGLEIETLLGESEYSFSTTRIVLTGAAPPEPPDPLEAVEAVEAVEDVDPPEPPPPHPAAARTMTVPANASNGVGRMPTLRSMPPTTSNRRLRFPDPRK